MPANQTKLQLVKLLRQSFFFFHSSFYLELETIPDFKNALKAIKPAQASVIDQLFASYGY